MINIVVENLVSNDVAWMVEELNKLYQQGKIKAFNMQILLKDDEFITGECGDINFIERLGLIEVAKHDIYNKANDLS